MGSSPRWPLMTAVDLTLQVICPGAKLCKFDEAASKNGTDTGAEDADEAVTTRHAEPTRTAAVEHLSKDSDAVGAGATMK